MFAVVALVFTACGGDDSADPADGAGAESAIAEAVEGGEDAASAGDSGEAIDPSSMSDSDCLAVGNSLTGVLARGMTGDFESDLATVRSFVAGAPESERREIETFLDAYESSVQILDGAGISLSDVSAMQEEGAQEIVNEATALTEAPEVEAGIQAAEDYLFTTCPVLAG